VLQVAETEVALRISPAEPDEFHSVVIGNLALWPPVVLAPMAGVTNYPFRSLCHDFGAPLCVGEMVTARPLAERVKRTIALASFGENETQKSIQLYGTDPHFISEAVKYLVSEKGITHLDLNFGCPVRKVTSQGGGAALPHKPKLLAKIVRAAVTSAGTIPVTTKFRMGVDSEHIVYEQTGHIAEEEGCAAVTLHARTAEQLYSGHANWDAIADLKGRLRIPVLGNGDVWEAADAIRMMRHTGCDGVVIGRGCLGRPWLFRDLSDMFLGRRPQFAPSVGDVVDTMLDHATRQVSWLGEALGIRSFRKQAAWYTKGFRASASIRNKLMAIDDFQSLSSLLATLDRRAAFPPSALRVPRCKDSGTQRVTLPHGFWENLDDDTPPPDHDCVDGG
jgi:nifR3 family TIM-barrel protein